MMKNIKARL